MKVRLQVDQFPRDIVYRRPSTRRDSILRYITASVIRRNRFSPNKGLFGEILSCSHILVNVSPFEGSTVYFTFFYICVIITVIILWYIG